MRNMLKRLQDKYIIAKANVIYFMNERILIKYIPVNVERVRLAEQRQYEREYQSMRKIFDKASDRLDKLMGGA
ncbi:hypothetical protein J4217_04665 [Candidatus Pacearchaeota archaeon]|nr:hypothetical protein [Candidatus Pacearchaeota archaeon]